MNLLSFVPSFSTLNSALLLHAAASSFRSLGYCDSYHGPDWHLLSHGTQESPGGRVEGTTPPRCTLIMNNSQGEHLCLLGQAGWSGGLAI